MWRRYLLPGGGEGAWWAKPLELLAAPFTKSPAQGAATSIHLASAPEVEGLSGKYWDDCRPIASSSSAYDAEVQRRLWAASEELVAAA